MRAVLRILSFRLLAARRWLRAQSFAIFVLGPLLVGGSWWIVDRYLPMASGALAAYMEPHESPGAVGLTLALLATASLLPSTFKELYSPRTAASYLDALPVPETARFAVALASCTVRGLLVLGGFLALLLALADLAAAPLRWVGSLAVPLLLVLPVWIPLPMLAAQLRVRLRLPSPVLLAAGFLVLGAGLWAPAGIGPWVRYALLPLWAAAAQLEIATAMALPAPAPAAVSAAAGLPMAEPGRWLATSLVLVLLDLALFLAWRRRDLETAGRLLSSPARSGWLGRLRAGVARLGRPWTARLGRPLAAQLVRDLLLVARRFSPAVYLAATLALIVETSVLTLLVSNLGGVWLQRGAVIGGVVTVLCCVSLTPLVLRHQLSRLWIERSAGVEPRDIWKAKGYLAAILALPPLAAGLVVLASLPPGPDPRWQLAVQLLLASAIVASLVGLASFEVAEQPLLGLVFSYLAGLALAGLTIFYLEYWWLWAVLYAALAGKLAERSVARVRFTEIEG